MIFQEGFFSESSCCRSSTTSDILPIEYVDSSHCFVLEDIDAYITILDNRESTKRWTGKSLNDVLEVLGAIVRIGDKIYPTRAGLLMFGKIPYILREFPEYHMDYIEMERGSR